MKFFRNPLFHFSLILFVVLAFQLAALVRAAFEEPTNAFPGSAPAAPLDTSSLFQTKGGGLQVQTLGVNVYPQRTLDVAGTFRASGLGEFGGNLNVVGTVTANDFVGSLSWSRLTGFPAACPSGQAVTAIGVTTTCATAGTPSQWTSTSTGIYYDGGGVGINFAGNPGSYKLYVSGTTFSTGGWESSDLRLKKNVAGLTNTLNKVLNLTGVYYDWKVDEYPNKGLPEGRQIGLIAQEVEKVFPELVSTGSDGYKALAYDRLSAILLEAIKEQQIQIEELRARLNHLENSN